VPAKLRGSPWRQSVRDDRLVCKPNSSVTATVTGYVPGAAVTLPSTVLVLVPGRDPSAEVVPTASERPAGRPIAVAVSAEPFESGSPAEIVTVGDSALP
jgi:hypothetical protein